MISTHSGRVLTERHGRMVIERFAPADALDS